jgi:hypothetical protein
MGLSEKRLYLIIIKSIKMIVLHPHINGLKPTDSTLSWWKFMVEQELPTLPEHLSSPPVFSGIRVTRSLVLYVCFVDRCLSFCTFSFGHCVVCSSSIYGF